MEVLEEASTVRVQRMRAGGKSAYDEMLKAQADSYVATVLLTQNEDKDVLTPNLIKRASFSMQHPAVITVTGISNSGKTWNIVTLITRGYLKPKPQKFVLFIEYKQKVYEDLESVAPVEYNYEIPSSLEEADLETSQRVCVLIDHHFQTTKKFHLYH